MTGVVKIADIPLRAAVLESPNLTRLVTERCLGAIPAAQRGLFTRTLAAYLAHDLHISEAAVELHVHPNTLRYRIRRFEELSGLRLERVDDLVAVWWALQYERITDRDGPAAAP
jgi:DNA-binding PucR family transcriptional regulator